MKKCSKCGIEKEKEKFVIDKRKSQGIGSECKECYNKHKQSFRDANRNKVNEKSREYFRKRQKVSPEKIKEESRRFRERHKEKLNEKRRIFWKKNAPRLRERQNELSKRPEQRKKIASYMRQYRNEKYADKSKANKILWQALKVKFIIRPNNCEKCGIECKPDGHHEDYSKPLEVQWLCHICHCQAHGKLKDIKIEP